MCFISSFKKDHSKEKCLFLSLPENESILQEHSNQTEPTRGSACKQCPLYLYYTTLYYISYCIVFYIILYYLYYIYFYSFYYIVYTLRFSCRACIPNKCLALLSVSTQFHLRLTLAGVHEKYSFFTRLWNKNMTNFTLFNDYIRGVLLLG